MSKPLDAPSFPSPRNHLSSTLHTLFTYIMDTESKNSTQETIQDVDFIQENVRDKASKPLVSTTFVCR